MNWRRRLSTDFHSNPPEITFHVDFNCYLLNYKQIFHASITDSAAEALCFQVDGPWVGLCDSPVHKILSRLHTVYYYSTVALLLPISVVLSVVVWRVDNSTDAVMRDQTNDSVGLPSDHQRPWNKCVKPLSGVYTFSYSTPYSSLAHIFLKISHQFFTKNLHWRNVL